LAYRIVITPKAQREIKSLPRAIQDRIRPAIRALRDNPYPPGMQKLKVIEDHYRIRVGDYRVVYAVEGEHVLVIVVTVGHRKDVYEKLSKKYDPEYLQSVLKGEK
jgi:mRNA interferase RelE/StbE